MKKDYWKWHSKKEQLNDAEGTALFHEREVWWCALGANIGYEQDGSSELFTRPVVILTKFNLDACLVVPLTTRTKKGRYYFPCWQSGRARCSCGAFANPFRGPQTPRFEDRHNGARHF